MDVQNSFIGRFFEAFSWMLIHSLWQGIVLAMIAALGLMMSRTLSARVKYGVLLCCFSLFVLSAVMTFISYWTRGAGTSVLLQVSKKAGWIQIDTSPVYSFISYFNQHASFVVLIWFVVFTFRFVRMIQGMIYIHKIRSSGISKVGEAWEQSVRYLSKRLGLSRAVRLLESTIVKVPVVVGHFRPLVLVPLGMLSSLPPSHIEAVLLHELAHIRRHDFQVNLLQTLTETIFFFNPGLLWISGLLKQEREHCCDELAIAQTGNRKEFVQALVSFQELMLPGTSYAVAFSGKQDQILKRARRILGTKQSNIPSGGYRFIAIAALLLLFILGITLTVAQINPSMGKLKPVPEQIIKLFKQNKPIHTDSNHEPSKTMAIDSAGLAAEELRSKVEIRRLGVAESQEDEAIRRQTERGRVKANNPELSTEGADTIAAFPLNQAEHNRQKAEGKRQDDEK